LPKSKSNFAKKDKKRTIEDNNRDNGRDWKKRLPEWLKYKQNLWFAQFTQWFPSRLKKING
jgi:hypothetical protein